VLSLVHPHTCHQALLDRVTACVSRTENTTKFCGCGKSRMHYLGLCCHFTLYCVLCKLKLSLRCVLSGCTLTSRPHCIYTENDCIPVYTGLTLHGNLKPSALKCASTKTSLKDLKEASYLKQFQRSGIGGFLISMLPVCFV
jgi:hypothetical protein